MLKNAIVAIDVGTSKIVTLISKFLEGETFSILGYGITPSFGVSKGIIVDVEEVTKAINKSIKIAEKMSGVVVEEAYVSFSGNHIESLNTHSTINLSKYPVEITLDNKNLLEETIEGKILKANRRTIHKLAYNYRIDDGNIIKNPVGMTGCKLDADIHLITGEVSHIDAILKCFRSLKINVKDLIICSLSSAYSNLTDTERKVGSLLLDIGGGTTDLAVFKNDKLIYTDVIPIGGEHFTQDIATILNIDTLTAEYIKKNFKYLSQDNENGTNINKILAYKKIDLKYLNAIIDSRVEDIVENIADSLTCLKSIPSLRSGFILTGGSSKIAGLKEKIEGSFQIPVRYGSHRNETIQEDLKNQEFSAALGILNYALSKNYKTLDKETYKEGKRNLITILREKIKKLIDSFLE